MEDYKITMQRIQENAAKIAEQEEIIKNSKWSERTAPRIENAAKQAELLKIENAVLTDNARRAFILDMIPAALDALRPYAGKSYGPKTEEKIKAAFKASTGHTFYIKQQYYSCALVFVFLNEKGFSGCSPLGYKDTEAHTIWNGGNTTAILTPENKINPDALTPGNFSVSCCAEYQDDARKHAEQIHTAFLEIDAERRALETKINAYNKIRPFYMKNVWLYDISSFRLF